MLETTLQQEVEALTQQLLATAGNHFQRDPGKVIVRFDLTGKAAGMAIFPPRSTPVIRFNALLLTENRMIFSSAPCRTKWRISSPVACSEKRSNPTARNGAR